MKSLSLEDGISFLNSQNIDFALIHEAAITAFSLNYSVFLKVVDVLVSDREFDLKQVSDDGSCMLRITPNGVKIRLWSESALDISLVQENTVWNNDYLCYVLDPKLVLEKIEKSPDIEWLLEQRARLAMVLYQEQMTDDELLLFHKYVRGD